MATTNPPFSRQRLTPIQIGLVILMLSVFLGIQVVTVRALTNSNQSATTFERQAEVVTSFVEVEREILRLQVEVQLAMRASTIVFIPADIQRGILANKLQQLETAAVENPGVLRAITQLQAQLDEYDVLIEGYHDAPPTNRNAATSALIGILRSGEQEFRSTYFNEENAFFRSVSATLNAQRTTQILLLGMGGFSIILGAVIMFSLSRTVGGEFERAYRLLEEERDISEKRTVQLEAAALVAAETTSIRDLNELLTRTTRLISEKFGFYHAGIFIIDENREYAYLRAASSEGGQRMLARSHRLSVGRQGLVGNTAFFGQPRIALDVGTDAVYFDNPDMPLTRSEIALPLQARGKTLGVLDVQSTQESAFVDEDIEILQTLANQIGVAIQNAQLLDESRQTLKELETLYQRQVQGAWQSYLRNRSMTYSYDKTGVYTVENKGVSEDLENAERIDDPHALVFPLSLRGQKLGTVVLRRDKDAEPWTNDEHTLAHVAGSQIALALENARLVEQTQQFAHREQIINQITTKIRRAVDVEGILKTTLTELGTVLNVHEANVVISTDADIAEKQNGHSP